MLRSTGLRRSHRNIPEGFHFLLEGKPHPLLIPSVIDEISSYLPLPDLKQFRLACKSFDLEASKRIKKISKVLLHDEDKLLQYTKLLLQVPLRIHLYSNYELRGDLDLGSDAVAKFFKIFGEPIQFIYFNRVRWCDSELRDILFNRLPNLNTLAVEARAYSDRRLFVGDSFETLPKIKILKLNVFSFITELTTPFLRDLLRACPSLEQISSLRTEKRNPLPMQFIQYVCQEMSYDTADDVVNMPFASDIAIAEALIEAKDISLRKLKILDCNMRLRSNGLEQLSSKAFPLKQLDLTLLSDVCTRVLHQLLNHVGNTLDTLKLKFHPRCVAANEEPIPELKNLRKLTLNGYKHSLKFLEIVPKLKSLTLVRLFFSQALQKEQIGLRFESKLECLEVHEDFSSSCTRATVEQLVGLFPKVTLLKLENLSDSAIQEVFRGYKGLKTFDGMNGQYSDAAVTGINNEILKSLGRCKKDLFDDDLLEEFGGDGMRTEPSILDLKDLRSLALASPKLTDLSIILGVLKCRNLRELHLLGSGVTDVSVIRIVDELDLFDLKTEYCFKVSRETVNYAKKKMKGRKVSINKYEGPLKQSEIPKFMRRNGQVTVLMDKVNLTQLVQ